MNLKPIDIKPAAIEDRLGESFANDLPTEYRQCIEEGLDVRPYEALFDAVDKMPKNEHRDAAAEILYQITRSVPQIENYPYCEPSDYAAIRACCADDAAELTAPDAETLRAKITGAWYGRIVGCLLGKPVEGMRTDELHPLL